MNLKQESSRGIRAKELLSEPLIRETLDGMKANVLGAFERMTTYDEAKLKELWLTNRVIGAFEKSLQTTIETGKLADIQIQNESLMQKAGRKFRGQR